LASKRERSGRKKKAAKELVSELENTSRQRGEYEQEVQVPVEVEIDKEEEKILEQTLEAAEPVGVLVELDQAAQPEPTPLQEAAAEQFEQLKHEQVEQLKQVQFEQQLKQEQVEHSLAQLQQNQRELERKIDQFEHRQEQVHDKLRQLVETQTAQVRQPEYGQFRENRNIGGRRVAENTEGMINGFARMNEAVFSLDNAKKVAAWYIETSEKIANQVIDFQERATGWAKDTPFAPLFEAQNSFARKLVERSANAARSMWQIEQPVQ
jgi:hypothetical protein